MSIIIYGGLADREAHKELLRTVTADQGVVDEDLHCIVVSDHFCNTTPDFGIGLD